jgi:hypothetical protein
VEGHIGRLLCPHDFPVESFENYVCRVLIFHLSRSSFVVVTISYTFWPFSFKGLYPLCACTISLIRLPAVHLKLFLIFIIIIIIIMQGIYSYVPETNQVSKVCSVAAVLYLQFMVQVMLYAVLNVLYLWHWYFLKYGCFLWFFDFVFGKSIIIIIIIIIVYGKGEVLPILNLSVTPSIHWGVEMQLLTCIVTNAYFETITILQDMKLLWLWLWRRLLPGM